MEQGRATTTSSRGSRGKKLEIQSNPEQNTPSQQQLETNFSSKCASSNRETANANKNKIPNGGKIKVLPTSMAKDNIRSNDPRLDNGVQNTSSRKTVSNVRTKTVETKRESRQSSFKRSTEHTGHGCHSLSKTRKGTNYKQHISEREKGERSIQANSQFETIEPICAIRKIQNGDFKKCPRTPSTRRPSSKNRSQTCLLLGEFSGTKQENSTFSMERKSVRIPLSSVRFTKILKVPMILQRNLNFRIIIYIDDMLIMGKSLKEIEMARDTTLFLLQNLGFVINWEKSALTPSKTIEFLGIRINSSNMTFAIPEKKTQSILQLCQETLDNPQISLRKLARIVGKLMSTAQAFTPAPIQVRFLQNLLRRNLSSKSYETKVFLSPEALLELSWWKENMLLHNSVGKPIKILPPEMTITSDAAGGPLGGWGAHCQGLSTGGAWSQQEKKRHINELEMIAAELAIKTFTKGKNVNEVYPF